MNDVGFEIKQVIVEIVVFVAKNLSSAALRNATAAAKQGDGTAEVHEYFCNKID